nr:hypothetical protein [Acidobacteriota bacterium]
PDAKPPGKSERAKPEQPAPKQETPRREAVVRNQPPKAAAPVKAKDKTDTGREERLRKLLTAP